MKDIHVTPLMSYLMSTLLLHKPDDPVLFLIRELENMINFRDNQHKPATILFKNHDLVSIFMGVDFMNRGSIDLKQYSKGNNFNKNHASVSIQIKLLN